MSSKRPSIAWRLAFWLTAGTSLLWAGAAGIALAVLNAELTETFDDSLRQSALRLLPLALHDIGEPDERREYRISPLTEEDQYFTYYIRDPAGRPMLLADDTPTELLVDKAPEGYFYINGHRALSLTDPRSKFGIVVVEKSDHRFHAVLDAAGVLFWPLAALIPLIGVGIWAMVRVAMRPLERLRAEIAARGGHNLEEVSSAEHPVELAPIADEVASLLQRLRAALDAERTFASSSAHELRTPIAGALAQTQQLALELEGRKEGARVREIESALRKLSELSEKLLQLSRLDAGFARAEKPGDMLPVLRLVARDANSQAGADVKLDIAEGTDLSLAINADAFAIAVANLIHNATRHGEPNTPIRVIAGPGRKVAVINSGPIVDPATLARLGQRFVRGDTSAKGSGLGLSIVGTIAEQTGGELHLNSPASGAGDGFEAVLVWPN